MAAARAAKRQARRTRSGCRTRARWRSRPRMSLGGEEDRFDALADRREVRSAPGLVLAARRTPQGDVTRRGGGHGGVDVADPRRSPSRRSRAPSRRTRAWRWCSGARSAEVGVAAVTAGRGGESRGRPFAAPRSVRRYAASRAGSMPAGAGAGSVVMSRPRTTKSATRIPTTPTAAPAVNAAWKPSVRATAFWLPATSLSVVVVVAIADSAAMPNAPPTCWEVLISPEARPACDGFTPASAAIEIGTNENPIPTAITRKPGSRSETYDPLGETWVKTAAPAVRNVMPVTRTGLTPTRVTSWAATADHRIAVPATARYAKPVFSGEYPSTCCMYSVSIRNIAKRTVPRISPATFAPTSVRSRKIESGISASRERASQARNPTSSTSAAVKRPIVSAEPQPYWFAC